MISTNIHNEDTAIWRGIRSTFSTVMEATVCELGNGLSISFWYDAWLSCGRLWIIFPVLFSFAKKKFCSVASQFRDGQWDIQLHANLSLTASRELDALLVYLAATQPQPDKGDTRSSACTDNKLSTAYFYHLLSFTGMDCPVAPYIWDRIIPHKHKVFLWLALRGRLNTRDNMMKKHWTAIVQHNGCDLCPAMESSYHIILRCKLATAVWGKLGLPQDSPDLHSFLLSTAATSKYGKLWHILFAACAVALWNGRNAQVFHNNRWSSTKVFSEIAVLLRLWCSRALRDDDRTTLGSWADIVD